MWVRLCTKIRTRQTIIVKIPFDLTFTTFPTSSSRYYNDFFFFVLLSVSCPPPLKPRDFVLQRSWLDTGPQGEQMLLSRSVPHKDFPPKKGYVRWAIEREFWWFSASGLVCFSTQNLKNKILPFLFQGNHTHYRFCIKSSISEWRMLVRLRSTMRSTGKTTALASE